MSKLGDNIRRMRIAAGASLNATAAVANIGEATLAEIERGFRVPTLPVAVALADTFGVSLDDLIGRRVPAPRSFAGTGRLRGESRRAS